MRIKNAINLRITLTLMISLSMFLANPVLAAADKISKVKCTVDGQIAKFNSGLNQWECAADNDTLTDLGCPADTVAKFDGTEWACAADEDTPAQGPAPPCFSDDVTDPDENGNGRYFDCGNGTVTGLILL